ncbi:MAG: metal-sensitive transcriptional regulator [Chloroflexales bacterium]|nr:metal-sensitive transcriptional regulator [Chloroflexales bacterium]
MADANRTISPATRDEVLPRLRRIEGQVRGIQRMIESGRDCREIFHQIAAVKAALNGVSAVVLECYAHNCLGDNPSVHDDNITELIEVMLKTTR